MTGPGGSFPPYVAGADAPAEEWIHCLRASALLEDAFGALGLKRDLDRGRVREDPRVVGRVGTASPATVASAVAAARAVQPEWAAWPLKRRLEVGIAVNERIRERAEEFVDVLVAEGHPRRLAAWEVTGVIYGSGPETFDAQASFMELHESRFGRSVSLVRKPDGVVALAPPRNAAASCSVLGLLALVAGNTVVVKAPRSAPYGVSWVWREVIVPVLEGFDVPAGAVNLVCGEPDRILDQWLRSPDVDDIMFFGSSVRGLAFERECVAHGKKPVLELAGNDGVLVWEDAPLDLAARAVAECFYGSSQICMVPKYAVVHPAVADDFFPLLTAEVAKVRPGLPEDPDVLLAPVLKTQDFDEVLAEALAGGATLLQGGQRTDHHGLEDGSGVFLQPTLLRVDGLDRASGLRAVREETFFPLLPVVVPEPAPDLLDDCLTFMETNPYGLRNSLWAGDAAVINRFLALRNGGILKVNDSHIGFAPGLNTHGGTGMTGGVFGEANLPMLRTTHLQGICITDPSGEPFAGTVLPEADR